MSEFGLENIKELDENEAEDYFREVKTHLDSLIDSFENEFYGRSYENILNGQSFNFRHLENGNTYTVARQLSERMENTRTVDEFIDGLENLEEAYKDELYKKTGEAYRDIVNGVFQPVFERKFE